MRPSRAHHGRRLRGMTLVELMVGLAVLGLLTVLASSYLSLGTRTWQRLDAKARTAAAVSSTQSLLRQMLTEVYPQTTEQNGVTVSVFDGHPESVAFEGFLPSAMRRRTIAHIVFALEHSQDGLSKHLIMKWHDDARRESKSVLLDHIDSARFSYYDSATDRWLPTWTAQPALPATIGLDVAFEGEGDSPGAWPRLVVSPMLTASATCLYDPGAQACAE